MSMNSFHARQGRPRHAAEHRQPVDRHGLLRVDQLLVAQGLAPSRTAARALIQAGRVSHEGQPVTKPALELPPDARLVVIPDDSDRFVSRGALKLEGARARSGPDVRGAVCLDIGLGKGGIVRDASLYAEVETRLREAAHAAGLIILDWFDSPITGGDGNREFFFHAIRTPGGDTDPDTP